MNRWIIVGLLALLFPAALVAQSWEDYDYENLGLRGIGLDVGGVWPSGVESTVALALRGDLGFAGPRVRISPSIRYWTSNLRQSEVERLGDQIRRLCERQADAVCPAFQLGEIERSDLELAVDAHYLFPTGYTLEPYLGGGLGIHLLNGSGEAIDDTFVEDLLDTVAPALNAVAGLNLPLGSALQLLAEARFVLVSDVRYMGFAVGGTWTLPSPGTEPAAVRSVR